ncbi:MAG: CotH kinase family protein [Chloroflexota bacterium]
MGQRSDQATFSGLAERLDVDAFATYLAMMELLDNFDDIDGPGNNAYLYWDATSGTFTIVPWDMNLAFGASMGGGQGGPNGRGAPGQGMGQPPAGMGQPPPAWAPTAASTPRPCRAAART